MLRSRPLSLFQRKLVEGLSLVSSNCLGLLGRGVRCCVGSWLQGFGESSSKKISGSLFSRVGPSRNFGVLPSNSLGGKKGRRKRGRGLGIAALMGAQRTGCSCCLHGNQYLRGRGLSGISSWRVSIIAPHPPALPIASALKQRWGDGKRQPSWGFHGKERIGAGDEMIRRRARSFKNWGQVG